MSKLYKHVHRLELAGALEFIPRIIFGLLAEVQQSRFFSIYIPNGCLFEETVQLPLDLRVFDGLGEVVRSLLNLLTKLLKLLHRLLRRAT